MRLSPRLVTLSALALALVWGSGTAAADRFDAAVKSATPIHTNDSLSALFWSLDANCNKAKGDFRRRQCQGVRDMRRAKIGNQTFVVDVGGPAIDLKLDAKKLSADVTLRACVACEDEGAIVVGVGAHKVAAKKIQSAALGSKTKVFKKLKHAEFWSQYAGKRLRAQLIFKMPPRLDRFTAAGRTGYKVSVVGYRLYDPCHGEVLVSKPISSKGPVKAASCKDEPAMEPDEPKKPVKPVIEHPDRLTTAQIKEAMKGVAAEAKKCHKAYQIDGMATFKMVIGGNGKLKKADQSGDFEGTPTGICLDKAMKMATFPKSKKKSTPITYPLMLQ
jgi:hypothetical protein